MNLNKAFYILSLVSLFIACKEETYTPKPKGYFKINLPEKNYKQFIPADCPFQFEIPEYSHIERDTTFFNERSKYPCWMNLEFDNPGGKIHISYRPVDNIDTLAKLIDDAHKLTFKHSIKADYIDEIKVKNQHNAQGILYQIGGNAASNLQFYVSDNESHFVRGSLYFPVQPNEDSLAPVIDFVKADILHLLETMEWKSANER